MPDPRNKAERMSALPLTQSAASSVCIVGLLRCCNHASRPVLEWMICRMLLYGTWLHWSIVTICRRSDEGSIHPERELAIPQKRFFIWQLRSLEPLFENGSLLFNLKIQHCRRSTLCLDGGLTALLPFLQEPRSIRIWRKKQQRYQEVRGPGNDKCRKVSIVSGMSRLVHKCDVTYLLLIFS